MQAQEIKPIIRFQNYESKTNAFPENFWTKGLNPQQGYAVSFSHDDGAALVLAGAGSGKTTVLTRRIARLYREKSIESGTKPGSGEILALTFTKDAAQEMAIRLQNLLDLKTQPLDFPKFKTFHAFAFELIRATLVGIPNWRRLGFSRSPVLMELEGKRAWAATVRKDIAPEKSLDQLLEWLEQPFATIGPLSSTQKPALKRDSKGGVPADLAVNMSAREKIRSLFRTFLFQSGCVAFDDMVPLAQRLITDFPQVLADFQARTEFVLVDEFQDTSVDQLELIRILMGKSQNLFLVGDDDQAIYGFRGANPGNIDAALKCFPGMHILKLETNYRSTAPIVIFANSVFSGKAPHLRKTLVAGRSRNESSAPFPVRKILHRDGGFQAHWLAKEMIRLHDEEGLAWTEIAILYRINALEAYYREMIAQLIGTEASQAIILSTVHGAKGLEYPAVFFVGLEDGILPYRRRREALEPERLAEERRIFYVGVTRAQRFLYLCSVKRRTLFGKLVEAEVSPFLEGRFKSILRRLRGKE